MSSQLKSKAVPSPSPLAPVLPTTAGAIIYWERLHGSSLSLALVAAARQRPGPLVMVTKDARDMQQFEEEIRFYAGGDEAIPVLPYPDWECLPYDAFSPHQDIISQRLFTLYRLPLLQRGIMLLSISNLMQRVPPTGYVAAHSFLLKVGDTLAIDELRSQLATAAYRCVGQVMEPGEFAVRGGLIDLFPMGSDRPYRIDLFGDEVESIRHFDTETQRSGDRTDSIHLLPAREFPMTPEGIRRFRLSFRERFEGDPNKIPMYRDVSKGLTPAGIEHYFPLFFTHTATVFDYLPASAMFLLDDGTMDAAGQFETELQERFATAALDPLRPALATDQLFLSNHELSTALARFPGIQRLRFTRPQSSSADILYGSRAPAALPVKPRADVPHEALLDYLRDFSGRVLLVAETAGRREVIKGILRDHGIFPTSCADWNDFLSSHPRLGITVAALERGLWLTDGPIALITEPQLYGQRVLQRRRRSRHGRDPEAIIRSLSELKIGDPVVHEDHGVGRYLGLQTLTLAGNETEFLTLEYQGGDKLYIPVLSLHLISRYTSTDPDHAPLHRLGSREWDKAKRRAREKVYDVAVELLEIQGVRAARKGHAFPGPDAVYAAFAADFPFEETPDQANAIEQVLADMESDRPMDRLVCGDVGFGKTEVALRAALVAVQGQHQAAVLVPTTLLAQQHYETFSDRFAELPVHIELLSRFRSKKAITQIIAGLKAGTVDIVIGTHRLLQGDIRFKRLGLVILDEEHRFGVRQKERLKQLRSQVDILTLTATPIPRTMNMTMAKLRDVSIIATPPKARLSVKTFVTEWNDMLVREACLREIRRGGQVYFLHNDVRTMEQTAARIAQLVPEAELRIAHGQMPEKALERVMQDFYHRRFSILLCSTIIESGIDVPTANTILINRADKFGLAQLHQLRGRVGRSHHRAYAYLLIPPREALKRDALQRLEVIAALDELGAGFALASHDLEIRGAGELLGEAQSGLIDEVGFSMYMELLNRAVASVKAGKGLSESALDRSLNLKTEINLHLPVLLPEDYLPDVHTRLIMYKRIASADRPDDLDDLRAEMFDRFGMLPEAAASLFTLTELKMQATPLGIVKIDIGPKGGHVLFDDKPDVDAATVIALLQSHPETYRLNGPNKLRISSDLPEAEERIRFVRALLGRLSPHIT